MTREEIEGLKTHYKDSERHADIWALIDALEAAWAKNDALLDTITLTTDLESRLRQRIRELERGEYICKRCGPRKDSEPQAADF